MSERCCIFSALSPILDVRTAILGILAILDVITAILDVKTAALMWEQHLSCEKQPL